MMRYSFFKVVMTPLRNDCVLRKFQQQLLGACILEGYGGLRILTGTLHLDDGADAKALMFYHIAFLQSDVANS